MKITLSIDQDLAKEVRGIAAERGTTLTTLVRSHLRELVEGHPKPGDQRRQLQALEQSFEDLQFNIGERTWTREELHARPSGGKSKQE